MMSVLISIGFESFSKVIKMRKELPQILRDKSCDLSFSQSRISCVSRISQSRVSSTSGVSMTPSKHGSNPQPQSQPPNNLLRNSKPPKPHLPPRHATKQSPYFSCLEKEQIHCVLCKKSYFPSELEAHLLLHKQSKPSIAPTIPTPTHHTRSTSKLEVSSPKSQSITKFKQLNPIPSTFSPSFSIANTIPLNQKISPPVPQPIFQPLNLGVNSCQQNGLSYQQLYLNPQNTSSHPFKQPPKIRTSMVKKVNQDDLQSMFALLNVKSCQSEFKRVPTPLSGSSTSLQKFKDHRKTETGDSSLDYSQFMRSLSPLR